MSQLFNILTAALAIASAFCWFRAVVAKNEQTDRWEKLSYKIDAHLEKVPVSAWNFWAAVLTALAASSQAISVLITVFSKPCGCA